MRYAARNFATLTYAKLLSVYRYTKGWAQNHYLWF